MMRKTRTERRDEVDKGKGEKKKDE